MNLGAADTYSQASAARASGFRFCAQDGTLQRDLISYNSSLAGCLRGLLPASVKSDSILADACWQVLYEVGWFGSIQQRMIHDPLCWVQFPRVPTGPTNRRSFLVPARNPLRFASSREHGPHARQPLDRSFGLSPRPGTAGIAPQLPSIACRRLAGILYILCCFFHHEVLQSHVSFAVLLREPGFGCAPLAARGLPDFASLWRSFTAERSSSQSLLLAVRFASVSRVLSRPPKWHLKTQKENHRQIPSSKSQSCLEAARRGFCHPDLRHSPVFASVAQLAIKALARRKHA